MGKQQVPEIFSVKTYGSQWNVFEKKIKSSL
jgi:hypothetical protein